MYKIECNKKWTFRLNIENYGKRISRFLKNEDKKNIIYIKNEFDNSTFRYRYYNFMQALENSSKYLLTCFSCDEIPEIIRFIDKIEMVVFQRTTWDNNVQMLIDMCKKYKIPVVYDIDDLIYNYNYIPDYLDNIGLEPTVDNVRIYMGIAAGHEMVAKQSDCFICTTNFLKDYLIKDLKKDCYVISNFYNIEQEQESEHILDIREYDESKFVIGYFSGSPSHLNDFRVCKKEVISLLKKYDNIYLKIVGFMNLDEDMKELYNKGRILIKPLCSYQKLQYEIAQVDINIAPLYDYYFNYAKSELKYFEPALVKVPSVVSSVGIYKEIIQDGTNGYLCKQGTWFDTLEYLYLNKEKRFEIANNAYEEVKKIYNFNKMASIIEKTFDDILSKKNK